MMFEILFKLGFCFLSSLVLLSSANAVPQGSGEVSLPEIGAHYRIFIVEKSENPQNILVAFTKLDPNCNIVQVDGSPLFDFYWLMDRLKYKPVHTLIKSGLRARLKAVKPVSADSRRFAVQMADLKELTQDLGTASLEIVAVKKDEGCSVNASIKLGPSDGGKLLSLTILSTESEKTLLPPFRKVKSVTLSGTDAATAQLVKRQYFAK